MEQDQVSAKRSAATTVGAGEGDGTSLSEIGRVGRSSAGVARFAILWAVLLAFSALGARIFESWVEETGSSHPGIGTRPLLSALLVVLCIITAVIARRSGNTRTSLAAGGVLVAALSSAYGITNAYYIGSVDALVVRPSWNAIMLLVFSLVVTAPLAYHVAMIVLISFSTGVAVGILQLAGAFPEEHLESGLIFRRLLLAAIPTWICAFMALAGILGQAAVQRRLRRAERDLEAARGELSELGAYTLERRIGQGGMGEVWRARHRILARPAAIKLVKGSILEGAAGNPVEYERICSRFEREARVTAQLSSPHTVQVFDYGRTADGSLYYVMELLDGMDLETLVRREGAQSQERTALFLLQALDSLAEAHARGLVHRDIKPANLFIARQGLHSECLKVLDFGLALSFRPAAGGGGDGGAGAARITQAGMITGTPLFMSPEQARGVEDLDGKADLYALGCVAWFLLTGRPIFEAPSPMDVLVAHLQRPPGRLRDGTKTPLDPRLEEIILRLLEKERALRPAAEEAAASIAGLGLHGKAAPILSRREAPMPEEIPAPGTPVSTMLLLPVRPDRKGAGSR